MHISDNLFMGTAVSGGPATADPTVQEVGVGPLGRIYVLDVVPLTLQAAGLATSQNPTSGSSFTLTAGTGVTASTGSDGVIRYTLDTPRNVTITAAGANTATYRVTGYDVYGQLMTETLAAPSTSTVQGAKAFKSIISVTNANATAGTNGLTVGFGDRLGVPVRVTDLGYIVSYMWNQAAVTVNSTNFTVADTNTATSSTGDVRGRVNLSSASDGIKRLVVSIAVPAIGSGPNATRVGAFGVTQA